ncbi:GNAT family N-acetyltransferase [Actinocorallia sp. B10E7]|uniref:GNAT family N-acetyltransferase n=1 Tax=Actinocorallia sp. B10E7 TaxID=3153558 RepID=UPI00325CDB46
MDRVFVTERLELRPVAPSDHAWLLSHWREPGVRRFLFDGKAPSSAEVLESIEGSERNFASSGYGLWIMRKAGEPLGAVGLLPFEDDASRPEMIISLVPAAWGRGYAAEAARTVVEHALETLRLPQVMAEVDRGNDASAALVARLGMEPGESVPGVLGPMTRYRRSGTPDR